jgi:MbtH protein
MFDDEHQEFHVVVNHEEQHSIWPADRDVPTGWRVVGASGTKAECLDYIDQAWTDMRPLSLRRQMADSQDVV